MKSLTFAVCVASLLATAFAADTTQQSRPQQFAQAQKYWVHCINGRTSVEQWDVEQMRTRHGSNVCQLHENTSASGAQDWMAKNFPSGECSC